MTNSTALQVTNFNFYGDELNALKELPLTWCLGGLDLQKGK